MTCPLYSSNNWHREKTANFREKHLPLKPLLSKYMADTVNLCCSPHHFSGLDIISIQYMHMKRTALIL